MVFRAATNDCPTRRHFLSDERVVYKTDVYCNWKFTNHSLRASGATALIQSEKIIQEFTGHRLVKALGQYEKVASQQKQAACNILNGGAPTRSFSTEVEKLHSVQ